MLEGQSAIQLAALLKKFFRDLPEPLLTHKLHKVLHATSSKILRFHSSPLRAFVELTKPEDRLRALQLSVSLLPKPNRDVLECISVFLAHVAKFPENKMDMSNLAIVIAPNILSPPKCAANVQETVCYWTAADLLIHVADD